MPGLDAFSSFPWPVANHPPHHPPLWATVAAAPHLHLSLSELAFAGAIAGFGFSPWYLLLSVLGFNLGIEAMHLAAVFSVVPWLLLLSRTRFYPPVRLGGAFLGGTAALAWIGQRAFAWPNPLEGVVDGMAHHAGWLVGGLAATAMLATWAHRGKTAAPVP